MSEKARTWAEITKPKAEVVLAKPIETERIQWANKHINDKPELLEILNREKPADHITRVFISTGDAELGQLCC